jgi:hypothetical protein
MQAQADLKGVIFEKGRKVKLSNINVYIPAENISATTDKNGEFVLITTSTKAEIKINASGYLPYTASLDEGVDVKIFLDKKPVKGGALGLTVEDTNYKKDQAMKSLNRKQIFDMPGANGDAVKAVQNLPGINRAQGFSSQVIIQGSAPKDTAYDFDGHEIPIVFHFGGLSSVVMPEAIDKVDYYSAGYQVERSRALGGVISLTTRSPEVTERDHKGLFYVDNLSAGGLFESKINDKQSFLISGRYSYVGAFLKAAMKDNEALNLTVAPEFYDVTGVYSYQLADNEKIRISFINSNDKLGFVFNEPFRQDPSIRGNFSNSVNFFRIVPMWEKKFDAKNLVKFSFAYGIDKLNVDIGDNYFNLESKNFSTRSRWEHQLNDKMQLNLGWDNLYSTADVKIRLPQSSSSGGIGNPISSGEVNEADINSKLNNLGLFTELEYKLTPEFKIVPGLRADYFSLTKESFVLPRFASQYKASEFLIYKMGSGLYVQSSEPQDSNKNFGKEDIKSPRAIHFSLGFDKDFKEGKTEGHFFGMNGFYKKFEDLVVSSSQKKIQDGVEVFERYNNEGTGVSYGIENQWKYQNDDMQVILSYTWSKSTRTNPKDGEYNFEYDQTHNLNLIGIYPLPNEWKISGRYRYVTGNPYTPVVGSTYDADNETYFPVRGTVYSERNSPFQQLDLRVDKKVILDEAIWTIYLDIQNILNIKNSEGIQYSYDYKIKQDVTGLPLLPSIGVRGEF